MVATSSQCQPSWRGSHSVYCPSSVSPSGPYTKCSTIPTTPCRSYRYVAITTTLNIYSFPWFQVCVAIFRFIGRLSLRSLKSEMDFVLIFVQNRYKLSSVRPSSGHANCLRFDKMLDDLFLLICSSFFTYISAEKNATNNRIKNLTMSLVDRYSSTFSTASILIILNPVCLIFLCKFTVA